MFEHTMYSSNLQGTQVSEDNHMRESCHPFYRGDIYLQETILWRFHPCQKTFGRDGQKLDPIQLWAKTGPNSVVSSFRTLG